MPLLERLDRAGIMVWQGIGPVDAPGAWTSHTPALAHAARERVRASVRQLQLHPSVIAWNLVNEIAGNGHDASQVAYVRDMARELHRRDPGRLVAVDLWGPHPPEGVPGAIYRDVDAVALTNYVGWYEGGDESRAAITARLHDTALGFTKTFKDKVLIVSEFGAEANASNLSATPGGYDYQSWLLRRHIATYRAIPRLSGMLVWNLQDFGVAPTFAGGSISSVDPRHPHRRGLNTKGLFDYAGHPKPAVAAVRRAVRPLGHGPRLGQHADPSGAPRGRTSGPGRLGLHMGARNDLDHRIAALADATGWRDLPRTAPRDRAGERRRSPIACVSAGCLCSTTGAVRGRPQGDDARRQVASGGGRLRREGGPQPLGRGSALGSDAGARAVSFTSRLPLRSGRGPDRTRIKLHRVGTLRAWECAVTEEMPTTTVARTLLDLAPQLRPRRMEETIAHANRLDLFDLLAVRRCLGEHPRQHGAPALRRLLDALEGVGTADVRSILEVLVLQLCDDYGLPEPIANATRRRDLGGLLLACPSG